MLKEVPVCVYADDLFMLLFFSLMQDCIQLNQYKLKSEIGKVSLFCLHPGFKLERAAEHRSAAQLK